MTQPVPPHTWEFPNPDGSTSLLSYGWNPPPPVPPMLVGNASGPVNLTRYPGTTVCTLFNSPGKGLNVAAIRAVPSGVYPIVCVKDPWSAVADQVATAAELGIRFGLVPHHEPEDDMQLADYLANFNAFADGVEGMSTVELGCKLNGYVESKPAADFHPWITKREKWVGLDLYSQSTTAYPNPDAFVALAISMQDYAGVPGGLTEFMALRIATDTTGAGRAGWIADVTGRLGDAQCRFAMPWDGIGTANKTYPKGVPFGPFPLTSPEYGAMRALVATQ